MNPPPAPPPEKVGLGWTVIDLKTGKPRSLESYADWVNAEPWLYTSMEIEYTMVADGSGGWAAVLNWEKTRIFVVDVKTHVRRELKATD